MCILGKNQVPRNGTPIGDLFTASIPNMAARDPSCKMIRFPIKDHLRCEIKPGAKLPSISLVEMRIVSGASLKEFARVVLQGGMEVLACV